MLDFIIEWVGKNYEVVIIFFGCWKIFDLFSAFGRS